ncbi:unnamed protein product [Eruca vesicaria subsp. sativa]|uniref:RRM domain-containing protein n=1 Tax=Eruca vesicaria subsp. sativa TaxID=29727 RepID=A0ABC8L3E8_ERUVS|nr:unnamed protein product [Eruca vesicaria subsp. sativa]
MASPTSSHGPSMEVTMDVSKTLNPTAPLFFPKNHFLHHYYFFPPQLHFISNTNLPPPSSIFVYYPLWYNNPNPTRSEFIEELPPQNPSQELSRPPTSRKRGLDWSRSSGHRKKVMWRRRVQYQAESSGGSITTVMLRNIPNKYTREMLIEFLDEHCEAENNKEENEEVVAYDFLYLPIDFQSKMNKGYAFVNFTKTEAVSKFKAACNNKAWYHFGSKKILKIAFARIQGKDMLVKHFEQMAYPAEVYSAVCFIPARSGPRNTGLTIMVGKCAEAMIEV